MFNDNQFEAGQEFVSDFVTNLKSRVYLPDNTIVNYGDSFDELVMIQESVVSVAMRVDKFDKYNDWLPPSNYDYKSGPVMAEFFLLPTYSYFGDY